jgi:bifunctional non-homologous end joining protein LigD
MVEQASRHTRCSQVERVTMRTAQPNGKGYEATTRRRAEPSELSKLVAGLSNRIAFTNLDKCIYPKRGITKAALLAYYALVCDWMLPHVANRPLTLVRCPDGPQAGCFYQKHATAGVPDVIGRIDIAEGDGSKSTYLAIADVAGLLGVVQHGTLELHVWGSRTKDVERPDWLVFDLDPDVGLPWPAVVEAACELRDYLKKLGLSTWVKTTGGKGLHVVAPIAPRLAWPEAKAFSKAVAEAFAARAPGKFTVNPLKAHRKGKIFVDYLRNARGATAVAPYSTRARPEAPVATPLAWAELERGVSPEEFDLTTVPERLRSLAEDPWSELLRARQSVTAALQRAVEAGAHSTSKR